MTSIQIHLMRPGIIGIWIAVLSEAKELISGYAVARTMRADLREMRGHESLNEGRLARSAIADCNAPVSKETATGHTAPHALTRTWTLDGCERDEGMATMLRPDKTREREPSLPLHRFMKATPFPAQLTVKACQRSCFGSPAHIAGRNRGASGE